MEVCMRRPKTIVGLALLFPVAFLLGCSDNPLLTEGPRLSAGSALLDVASDPAGAIVAHDSCDPATFNGFFEDPTICVKEGRTTFDAFVAELTATKTARSWRFNPLRATAQSGQPMLAQNVGGEVHTFTPVKKFGGGFIGFLNDLTDNKVAAPECLNIPALDFVASGAQSLIPAAALSAAADANGIARVECCIHPWMRAEVRIR
jgi:hypothetical protein